MSELERAETTGVLASLAAEINAEHRACEAAATTALEHAIRCGELLLEAKRRKPHGGWMAWVAANFEGSHDLANKYMRVARNSERVLNLLNEGRSISLRGALEEIKTAERRKRDAIALERRESAERVRTLSFAGDVEIHHCDFRGLELPDESVDMVFTDPPYPGEYLPLWKDLSHFAAKALKPGGVLIAYSGQYHLLEVMNNLAAELEYLWLGSLVFHGPKNAVQQTEVQNAFKPLLFYRRRGDAV